MMEYTDEFAYAVPEEALDYGYHPVQDGLASLLGRHGLTLVAILLILFMGYKVIGDRMETSVAVSAANDVQAVQPVPLPDTADANAAPLLPDQTAFTSPYENYTLTQGVHGAEYGHMAIDIAAGQGVTIKSPIHGTVSALYVDEYGNPTLVIENEVYQIMMLHGQYPVTVGESVELGQAVGFESNLGYTVDMAGVSCWGRDCGYHTHLNVFDKRIGGNVNPLELMGN